MRYRNGSATVLPKRDNNADPHIHRVVVATKVVPVSRIESWKHTFGPSMHSCLPLTLIRCHCACFRHLEPRATLPMLT